MTRETRMATPEDQKPAIDYRPTIGATLDPRYRQRHDIPWSQPLPLYPPTLAEEPLPEPRCAFREWTSADEAIEDNPSDNGTGPRCPHTALWLSCRPYVGAPTCEEHKCRCAKPIQKPDAAKPEPPARDHAPVGPWRVGRKLGRTVYLRDRLVGTFDNPGLAQCAVNALNALGIEPKSEPPASEPSGKPGVKELFDTWWERVGTSARVSPRCTFEGGFDVGWAARDAEVAELKRELIEERVALELVKKHCTEARSELEAERAAHVIEAERLKEAGSGALDMADRLAEELQKARSARRLPTREAVIAALLGQADKLNTSPPALADAVLALFGAQEEQDSGYRPTIDEMVRAARAPLAAPSSDERPWNFDAPPDSEIGQQHELLPNDPENEAFDLHTMIYSGLETRVDAQPRWDDKASGAYRVMGMSVAAWRRVAPAQPKCLNIGCSQLGGHNGPCTPDSPTTLVMDGRPTGWLNELESLKAEVAQLRGQIQGVSEGAKMRLDGQDARLEKLCRDVEDDDQRIRRAQLDGRVTRRLVESLWMRDDPGGQRPFFAQVESLEREERER
jgi:hypothetical protein